MSVFKIQSKFDIDIFSVLVLILKFHDHLFNMFDIVSKMHCIHKTYVKSSKKKSIDLCEIHACYKKILHVLYTFIFVYMFLLKHVNRLYCNFHFQQYVN